MHTFHELREKYHSFIYKDYTIEKTENGYHVTYSFCVPGLTEFNPTWDFEGDYGDNQKVFEALVFNLGMVESISYWKCACPPILEIACGTLSTEQIAWWKKLFYHGLGEFLYRNNIEVTIEDLVTIQCPIQDPHRITAKGEFRGCLVPVGGGKDSVVSLELLKDETIYTYSINGGTAIKEVIALCDTKRGDLNARRKLDSRMLDLNKEGFLNGHTPFSAIVAFSSVITAFLNGIRYITLSNETSANETTVRDSSVNHQYSKSLDFENDFRSYIEQIIDFPVEYFSLLRPLTEIQIAKLFSHYKNYHKVFRSCNVGSKSGVWCCNCAKCLFVYIILSPFLSDDELIAIFGENLLDKPSLEKEFRELLGIEENKPFECVGTRKEVLVAMKHYLSSGRQALLVNKYREKIQSEPDVLDTLLNSWSDDNNTPEEFCNIMKRNLQA